MDSYNKLFMVIRKTDLLNYDEKKELQLYLMNLQEQVKKQKEVIDKVANDLNIILEVVREQPLGSDCWIIDRLEANKNILKEVEQ